MPTLAKVRERTEEQAQSLSEDQQCLIRTIANDLHRLNQSVVKAVEAGVGIELIRTARHHGGAGVWGDLLVPIVVAKG